TQNVSGGQNALSSILLLQSSSLQLHASVVGPTAPWQNGAPFLQMVFPPMHGSGRLISLPHDLLMRASFIDTSGSSSTSPLQCSASLLQISPCGPWPPTHESAPPEHCIMPLVQMPTPHFPDGQQATFAPCTSSILPLQSSSRPLQISPCGSTSPTHGPNCGACGQTLAVHFCNPPWQMPTPSVPCGPP